jgi:hypothetical protein
MITLDIKHSKLFEDGYHEGWCNFSVNDYEFLGYGEPADYNLTDISYWVEYFSNLETKLQERKSYYFWQFDTDGWWLGFKVIDAETVEVLSGELIDSGSMINVDSESIPDGLRIKHQEIITIVELLKAIRDSLNKFP